jgi:hypothetical protein
MIATAPGRYGPSPRMAITTARMLQAALTATPVAGATKQSAASGIPSAATTSTLRRKWDLRGACPDMAASVLDEFPQVTALYMTLVAWVNTVPDVGLA